MAVFEEIKEKITSRQFDSERDARMTISSCLIKGQISNAEHSELRFMLNEAYN